MRACTRAASGQAFEKFEKHTKHARKKKAKKPSERARRRMALERLTAERKALRKGERFVDWCARARGANAPRGAALTHRAARHRPAA